MILSFDVQLQVALRALQDVVAPALADGEKHVIEQLHLAIVTIAFVKTRLPDARRFARMELGHFVQLAEDVASCAGGDADISALVAQARDALSDPIADNAAFEALTSRLREAITALGSRCPHAATRDAIDRVVLNGSAALLGQYRQWTVPFGIELKPEELPAPAW
jgi:hypothetical protein